MKLQLKHALCLTHLQNRVQHRSTTLPVLSVGTKYSSDTTLKPAGAQHQVPAVTAGSIVLYFSAFQRSVLNTALQGTCRWKSILISQAIKTQLLYTNLPGILQPQASQTGVTGTELSLPRAKPTAFS